jgi:protoheme IX farnesyltransferase
MLSISSNTNLLQDIRSFSDLMKFRLSFFVVFSGVVGFSLATLDFDFHVLLWFALGSFLVTGSANAINQLLEEEYDVKMKRTMSRPLPSGRLNGVQAGIFAIVAFLIGSFILMFKVNLYTCILSATSLFLYAFVYTPLKRVGPIAVFVGAIPGALPPLIGWVAATNSINLFALILFAIQFVWQFPHFWAIAWVLDEDYKKAGFRLLPSDGGKNLNTAFQIMVYTLFLIPLGLLPTYFGLTGINSAVVTTCAGVLFLAQTFHLMKDCSNDKAAKQIMFGSFIYLLVIQIVFMIDRV